MRELNRSALTVETDFPIKVLQFGAGNFLRAFVDWMIQILNEEADFQAQVAVIKPTSRGDYSLLGKQEGLFHVELNGYSDGHLLSQKKLVSVISTIVNPYQDWSSYLDLARVPSIRFVISNTTEAGIKYSPGDKLEDQPASEFPGKLTQWLYARFQHFEGDPKTGCILLPCELIEENGRTLRHCVLEYSKLWDLGDEFEQWIKSSNYFADTLVDRIVSGYPFSRASKIEKDLGFQDQLLVTGEAYHSWIIQGSDQVQEELPVSPKLNIQFVDDLKPYREMKVRILNGAHTAMVPPGLLMGIETVDQVMADPLLAGFAKDLLELEVLPTLPLPLETKLAFEKDTLDRFRNAYLKHRLESISLNSISKFRTRLLPSLQDYHSTFQVLPKRITIALASLLNYYQKQSFEVNDDPEALEFLSATWATVGSLNEKVRMVLGNQALWGEDLNQIQGLGEEISRLLKEIEQGGIKQVLAS